MKIFISQPMHGISDNHVERLRGNATRTMKEMFPNEHIEVLDQFHIPDVIPSGVKYDRVFRLGRSIQIMAEADLIVFIGPCVIAKGCSIEYFIAQLYGIPCVYLDREGGE